MHEGPLAMLSFAFSKTVLDICKFIQSTRHEFVISDQLLRSGTSVMANIQEAGASQSRRDFISKMCIARKELRETKSWIELLTYGKYIDSAAASNMQEALTTIYKLLNASIGTARKRLNRKPIR